MNYLFTAAGEGTRFKNNGIKFSKPLIKVFGKELLIWSLESFSYKEEDLIFIITQKKAMIMSIKVNASPQRLTLLKDLLTDLECENFNFEAT